MLQKLLDLFRKPEPTLTIGNAGPHSFPLQRLKIDGFTRVSPLHGIPYVEFLASLHAQEKPVRYFEIGTQYGVSLAPARGPAVAVDPNFVLDREEWASKPGIHLCEMTSDAYFSAHDPRETLGGDIDLAFIDGMHWAEYVLRDFVNTERYCAAGGVIVLHDAVPINFEMTERENRADGRRDKKYKTYWTGDVWRVLPVLARERPDLRIQILDCPPTGLVLVSNLNPQDKVLPARLDALVDSLAARPASEASFWRFLDSVAMTDSRLFMNERADSAFCE